MECVVEAVSSTRKKLVVSLAAEEVNAALNAALAEYRRTIAIPGFRKGKTPSSVLERRFGAEIAARATQDKLNAAVDKALADADLTPLSGMETDGASVFKRDDPFSCSFSFDVLPEIDFPDYVGLPVEQIKAEASEDERRAIVEGLRDRLAVLSDAPEGRLPMDGDVVDVDYSGADEEGKPLDDVKGEHFSTILGRGEVLPDFEALAKTMKVGEEKTGPVRFPEDYAHAPLAGRTVTFSVKLNSLKLRSLPEVDDEFAKKLGSESLEKLEADVTERIAADKRQTAKNAAMQTLLDGLMAKVSFDVPAILVEARIGRVLGERAARLERMGKKLEDLGKSDETLREEAKAEALESLRPQVFLMALARREKLSVSDQDVEMAIYSMAMRTQQDYKKLREAYMRSGLIHELRDRMLADKAMEFVYSKAVVTEVEAAPAAAPASEPAPQAEAASEPAPEAKPQADD